MHSTKTNIKLSQPDGHQAWCRSISSAAAACRWDWAPSGLLAAIRRVEAKGSLQSDLTLGYISLNLKLFWGFREPKSDQLQERNVRRRGKESCSSLFWKNRFIRSVWHKFSKEKIKRKEKKKERSEIILWSNWKTSIFFLNSKTY